MMHAAIDARLAAYRTGGITTYVLQVIGALAALWPAASACRLTVLHSRKATDPSAPPPFRRAVLWTPPHHRLERVALSAELARLHLDVLHSPDFIPPARGAARHVITVHDLTFLHYPQFITAESRRYYNGHIEQAVRQADAILTDSEASRRDLVDILGVPSSKIRVHMLGVDPAFRPLPRAEFVHWARLLQLPNAYFLFVGTFEPRKNIAGLLRAYRALRDQAAHAPPLLLAGKRGWLYEETLALIDHLKLRPHVRLLEALPNDALPALYGGALALVTPSHYEGFGLPALEAMACGTVPIVSDRASLPEVTGDVGLKIDPDRDDSITEALRRAWQDDAWRAQESARALARAAQFTWVHTARIVLDTYQAVCSCTC